MDSVPGGSPVEGSLQQFFGLHPRWSSEKSPTHRVASAAHGCGSQPCGHRRSQLQSRHRRSGGAHLWALQPSRSIYDRKSFQILATFLKNNRSVSFLERFRPSPQAGKDPLPAKRLLSRNGPDASPGGPERSEGRRRRGCAQARPRQVGGVGNFSAGHAPFQQVSRLPGVCPPVGALDGQPHVCARHQALVHD